jgi:hypothetical protein
MPQKSNKGMKKSENPISIKSPSLLIYDGDFLKKFMLLYMAPVAAEVQMNVSPEEMKKGMEPWMAWYNKNKNSIVDLGAPLGKGACVDTKGNKKTQTQVTGYSIIQAEDIESVKAIIANHPHLMMPQASIEILEIMPMNM